MSKSRMAVRNKEKRNVKQFNFNFTMPQKTKSFFRLSSLFLILSGAIYFSVNMMSSWTEVWPVNSIKLQGDKLFVTKNDITAFVKQQTEKGMLSIDLQLLQKNAKKIDWVKNVEIRKNWPNELFFNVDEHKPVANFKSYILTQQDTLIKQTEKFENALASSYVNDLPVIEIFDISELTEKSAANIWHEFKQMKREFELLHLSLSNLKIDEANNWKLSFIDGPELNLGRKNRLERAERLVKIYNKIDRNKEIKQIDLRYHNGLAVEWFDTEQHKITKKELTLKG